MQDPKCFIPVIAFLLGIHEKLIGKTRFEGLQTTQVGVFLRPLGLANRRDLKTHTQDGYTKQRDHRV